jgi:hypothetical protein
MEQQDSAIGTVIDRLGGGWTPAHYKLAEEFLHQWGNTFHTCVTGKQVGDNMIRFGTYIESIRLRGMDEIPCLLVGSGAEVLHHVRSFLRGASNTPFVITFSTESYNRIKAELSGGSFLLLSPAEAKILLAAGDPHMMLKRLLWEQISKRRLIPFNFLTPARGSMFFGRNSELERLADEDDVSFAVAGPGRIGKTSLLERYRETTIRDRAVLRVPEQRISFYECEDTSDTNVARYFAMKIDPSKQSERMTADGLVNFLRYQQMKRGAPLNLLLDEVDRVCESAAFKYLGDAAVRNLCRLVLCGKGVLMRLMLSPKSPLECRLDLIRPGPLDERSARDLLLLPLADLGFKVADPDAFAEYVLRLTGRLPHLIHIYGKRLAQMALHGSVGTLSVEDVETLKWDDVVAQYFIEPLLKITDRDTRIVGLSLLRDGSSEFSIPTVQNIAARARLEIDYAKALEICIDLTINNVLTWHRTTFSIANEGLRFYALEMNFLDRALEDELKKRP